MTTFLLGDALQFPMYIPVFGKNIHPHHAMEFVAYAVGLTLTFTLRRRRRELADPIQIQQHLWILVGALFGALAGAKLLAWIESPDAAVGLTQSFLLCGKTVVGGLLGAWLGVELAKKCMHITRSTGDAFVFPLCLSMAIGRVGCFLTGLEDHTYGNFTSLPWAVDFGDGPRHPTQLYDIVFLALLALVLWRLTRKPLAPGTLFRLFVLAYCAYRFAIEFIKPTWKPIGISPIQVASLIGVIAAIIQLRKTRTEPSPILPPATPHA